MGATVTVLNALRHLRFYHLASLSACLFDRQVLNALRHLRFYHVRHGFDIREPGAVLNALRHLRFYHSRYVERQDDEGACAQRLAVSEVLPPDVLRAIEALSGVLNALRHLRFYHPLDALVDLIEVVCSTPCGI